MEFSSGCPQPGSNGKCYELHNVDTEEIFGTNEYYQVYTLPEDITYAQNRQRFYFEHSNCYTPNSFFCGRIIDYLGRVVQDIVVSEELTNSKELFHIETHLKDGDQTSLGDHDQIWVGCREICKIKIDERKTH